MPVNGPKDRTRRIQRWSL